MSSPDFPQVDSTDSKASIKKTMLAQSSSNSSNDGHPSIDDLVFDMTGETGR